MRIQFDCCECIFTQLIRMSRELDEAPDRRWEFFQSATALFQEHCRTATPPELAAHYLARYAKLSGVADPYMEIKDNSTAIAVKLYNELAGSVNSFELRLKLAISGNMIDYGVNPDFDLADWVLSHFTAQEDKALQPALERAAEAALAIIDHGIYETANRFNGSGK